MSKKKTLKQIVFELLDAGKLTDQNIYNETAKHDIEEFSLMSVQSYEYIWKKKKGGTK